MIKIRVGIAALLLGIFISEAYAFTLICPEGPLYFEDNTLSFSVTIITTNGALSGTYAEVNIVTPVGTYQQNVLIGEGNASDDTYIYTVPLTLTCQSFDGNVNVLLSVDGEVNSCSFVAYDYPRIIFSPSTDVTNAEFISIRCEDYSECNVTQVVIGENTNYLNSPEANVFVPEGYITISAVVIDSYGNKASSSISILVDRTPPSIENLTFTGVLDGYVLSFSANDYEGSGVVGYSIRVGDAYYCEAFGENNCSVNPDAPPDTYSVIIPPLNAGTYSVIVMVHDAAGNSAEGRTKLTVIDPANLVAIEGPFFDGNVGQNGWYISPVSVWYSPLSDAVLCTLNESNVSPPFEILEEGNHVFTCSSGENNVSFFIPIDYTPPSLPLELNYYFTPALHFDLNVYDAVSGVEGVTICLDGNCVDSGYTFPLPSDGNHIVRVIASDVAGNTEEKEYNIVVDSNSFIADLNVPPLVTEENVSVSWASSPLYNGSFIVSLDGNELTCNASPCAFVVASGSHTLCISVPGYPEINKCAELNADLYAPSVILNVPRLSRSRFVTVSWSASDDFRVVSTVLSADKTSHNVPSTGSKELYLSTGTHEVCVSVKDAAGRKVSKCATIRVRPVRRPRPPPKPIFPRDEIDKMLKQILELAKIKYTEVRVISENNGHGFVPDHEKIAEKAKNEFNVNVIPLYTEWTERVYSVDGKQIVFVQRHLKGTHDRVYEYFEKDINIYSPYLISLRHGSTLAEFSPETGQYAYIVLGDMVGVPLELNAAPLPPKGGMQIEEKNKEVGRQNISAEPTSAEKTKEEQENSAATGYAVLVSPEWSAVFVWLLVLAGFAGIILASRRR